jgi:serine/threonine-protein kinase
MMMSISGYEIIRVLARNGCVVYEARSAKLGRIVVLKVHMWEKACEAREAAALVGLEHPNILRYFDVGEFQGCQYFAFEYVEAETLAQRLSRGPLPDNEARRVAILMALALQSIREAGLTANLSPANVFLTEPPKLYIYPEASPGVLSSAPEEMFREHDASTEMADVYQVGALLYMMLTCEPPVSLEILLETHKLAKLMRPRKLNPAVDRALEAICMKCLERVLSNRFDSLAILVQALSNSRRRRGWVWPW